MFTLFGGGSGVGTTNIQKINKSKCANLKIPQIVLKLKCAKSKPHENNPNHSIQQNYKGGILLVYKSTSMQKHKRDSDQNSRQT